MGMSLCRMSLCRMARRAAAWSLPVLLAGCQVVPSAPQPLNPSPAPVQPVARPLAQSRPAPAPRPAPKPAVQPAPAVRPVAVARAAPSPALPAAPEMPWDVAPLSAGDWRYSQDAGGTVAAFGPKGGQLLFELRCQLAARQIVISSAGMAPGAATVTIRTSFGDLVWPVSPAEGRVLIMRPARDPGFDWIAFSRGRIAVELAGHPRLIIPVWTEMLRVIEDCRG